MKQTRTICLTMERADMHSGPLILVNKQHPVYDTVITDNLAELAPNICMQKHAVLLYENLIKEIGANGQILPVSGYRSKLEQAEIFAASMLEHGEEYTNTYVALPGCSEHQTGLAVDVAKAGEDVDFLTPNFPYYGICQQFRMACVRYGFIQRYPQGKELITGIGHEPWHFRYVGIPHAQLITHMSLTLEEYILWVKQYPHESKPYHYQSNGRAFTVGFVPAQGETTQISLQGEPYTVSGNNSDGFIVTVWGCSV